MNWFILILFVVSFLVLAGLILSKLSLSHSKTLVRVKLGSGQESLGSYFWLKFRQGMSRLWHFILEAKDLKPAAGKTIHSQMERVKKVFRIRIRTSEEDPHWLPEAQQLEIKPQAKSQEELYLEAIKQEPNDIKSYEALGRLYLQNKNFTDAAETYQYLTSFDPLRDNYWSNLGLALYSLGRYDEAIKAYEKALAINKKVPTRWINLALCLDAKDDQPRTIKALLKALGLDQTNVHYWSLLGDAYIKMDNKIRAEEVLEQILALDPSNKPAREKLMKLRI